MKTVLLNRFDGGIVNDPRSEGNVCRMCTNFDILTNPHRLTPYRDSESGDSAPTTSQKQNFVIALRTGTTYSLYALGVISGTAKAEVLYKDLTTGGSTDLDDSGWSTPANNQSSSGSTNFELFVYYKKTGFIYGARANSHIWRFDPAGGAFVDAHQALSYTNIAQGLVHSKDDIFYVPYDNNIAKNDNGSWTPTALTLPKHLYITSISEYGNYLAIACAPLSGLGNSVVYLWDRDSTLATLSESIDWGEGNIKILEEINGFLVGISLSGNGTSRFKDRIIFKYYSGVGGAQKFMELEGGITSQLPLAKQKINNRLNFMMSVSLNGAVREGVWSVGKTGDRFTLVHERTPNNDTALTSGTLKNFFYVGDFLFQSYTDSGSFALSKTNDTSSYTATSIIETKINPGFPDTDKSQFIKLYAVGALYDALPAAGQVVVKHRIQGGTYATIFTETTDGATYTEPVSIYADGTQFNDLTKEHEFRVESTGGAVPVALIIRYDTKLSNA